MRPTGPPGGGRHLGRVVALCPCAAESAFAPAGTRCGSLARRSRGAPYPYAADLARIEEDGLSAATSRYARARPAAHSPRWVPGAEAWPVGRVGRHTRMRPIGPLEEVGTSAASWRLCPCAAEER